MHYIDFETHEVEASNSLCLTRPEDTLGLRSMVTVPCLPIIKLLWSRKMEKLDFEPPIVQWQTLGEAPISVVCPHPAQVPVPVTQGAPSLEELPNQQQQHSNTNRLVPWDILLPLFVLYNKMITTGLDNAWVILLNPLSIFASDILYKDQHVPLLQRFLPWLVQVPYNYESP